MNWIQKIFILLGVAVIMLLLFNTWSYNYNPDLGELALMVVATAGCVAGLCWAFKKQNK